MRHGKWSSSSSTATARPERSLLLYDHTCTPRRRWRVLVDGPGALTWQWHVEGKWTVLGTDNLPAVAMRDFFTAVAEGKIRILEVAE